MEDSSLNCTTIVAISNTDFLLDVSSTRSITVRGEEFIIVFCRYPLPFLGTTQPFEPPFSKRFKNVKEQSQGRNTSQLSVFGRTASWGMSGPLTSGTVPKASGNYLP